MQQQRRWPQVVVGIGIPSSAKAINWAKVNVSLMFPLLVHTLQDVLVSSSSSFIFERNKMMMEPPERRSAATPGTGGGGGGSFSSTTYVRRRASGGGAALRRLNRASKKMALAGKRRVSSVLGSTRISNGMMLTNLMQY